MTRKSVARMQGENERDLDVRALCRYAMTTRRPGALLGRQARPVAIGVLLVAVAALVPQGAAASSCCGTGPGLSWRLAPGEGAAVGLSIGAGRLAGSWARDGSYASTGARFVDLALEPALDLRVSRAWQLGLRAPLQLNLREAGRASGRSGGLGDVRLSARWDTPLESFAIRLGAQLPTGRGPSDSADPLGADVTGTGETALEATLLWEGELGGPFTAMAAAGASLGLPAGGSAARRGSVEIAAGPWLSRTVQLALGALHERELSRDGTRTAVKLLLLHELAPAWNVGVLCELDLPLSSLGETHDARQSVTLALRRAFFSF